MSLDNLENTESPVERQPQVNPKPEVPAEIFRLYQQYASQLTAAIRRSFGNGPPDPEDVAQQSFQKLIERGDLESIRNLKGFLWRIARNLVLGEKRSQEVRLRYDYEVEQLFFPLGHDESDPQRVLMVREQLKSINDVMRNMPEKRRRAVILHRVEGLSVTDVGRRLGISRQNAAKHLANGIADLNVAIFRDDGDSQP